MISVKLDPSGIREARARLKNVEKAIIDATSVRQARRIGDFGKDQIAIEVRKFAKNRTGRLEKSWSYRSKQRGDQRVITWVSSAPYARIHDEGGTIRPVRAKALTIPQTFIARRVPGPRKFPGKLRATPWGLVDQQGTTQYVWAHSVRIPRTRYLQKALATTRFFARQEIVRSVRKSFRDKVKIK